MGGHAARSREGLGGLTAGLTVGGSPPLASPVPSGLASGWPLLEHTEPLQVAGPGEPRTEAGLPQDAGWAQPNCSPLAGCAGAAGPGREGAASW